MGRGWNAGCPSSKELRGETEKKEGEREGGGRKGGEKRVRSEGGAVLP